MKSFLFFLLLIPIHVAFAGNGGIVGGGGGFNGTSFSVEQEKDSLLLKEEEVKFLGDLNGQLVFEIINENGSKQIHYIDPALIDSETLDLIFNHQFQVQEKRKLINL